MKVSNGYFKHPMTGEIIKPGEMYEEFDKRALVSSESESAYSEAQVNATGKVNESGKEVDSSMTDYTLTELKKRAKEKQIAGASQMKKDELILALNEAAKNEAAKEAVEKTKDESINQEKAELGPAGTGEEKLNPAGTGEEKAELNPAGTDGAKEAVDETNSKEEPES